MAAEALTAKAGAGAAGREIGLIHEGRLFAVVASDSHGQPLSPAHFAAAVQALLDQPAADPAALPFVAPSVLGSEVLAEPLGRLREDEHNLNAYARLSEMLFTLTVVEQEAGDAGAAEHLRRATVEPGCAWVYKPISYGASLQDGWIALHVEHSTVDGATLVAAIKRMQDAAADAGEGLAQESFLSTTSIGGADQIIRYAFAPSVQEGFGISYTPYAEEFEYCVAFWKDTAASAEEFCAELGRAAAILAEAVDVLSAAGDDDAGSDEAPGSREA